MWGSYHQLRSSTASNNLWVTFVQQAIRKTTSPFFYQHVTHYVFKLLMKKKFVLLESKSISDATSPHLTRIEENTLRYVAGYVCRKVKRQLECSKHDNKDNMILYLMELNGDENDEERGTEDWTNLLDRGELWHVSDTAYNLFYAIEEEVRSHLVPDLEAQMYNIYHNVCYDAQQRSPFSVVFVRCRSR